MSREQIVFVLRVVLFATLALMLTHFLGHGDVVALFRDLALSGIVAAGIAILVVGRGIDLPHTAVISQIAVMAVSAAFASTLTTDGDPIRLSLLAGLIFAAAAGFLIAGAEISAPLATLFRSYLRMRRLDARTGQALIAHTSKTHALSGKRAILLRHTQKKLPPNANKNNAGAGLGRTMLPCLAASG